MISNTPNAQDGFSRYMAEAFDEKKIIGVPTGFQRFFGRPESGAETLFSPDANVVDIDIIRGNERTAALLPRGTVSRALGGTQRNQLAGKYSSFSRKFPLSEEEGDISANQIINRIAGETAYATKSRLDRMRDFAVRIYEESIRRHVRLFEVLASTSIITGKMPAILGTTNDDLIYDFKRNASNDVTVTTAWDQAGTDILGDIDAACALVRSNGKMVPDFMAIGASAWELMLVDATFQAYADKFKFNFAQVGMGIPLPANLQGFVDSGWIYKGKLHTPAGFELNIFTYIDVYEDANGVSQKYMPDDRAFITSSRARFDRYFGPAEMLPLIPQRVQLYQELFGFNLEMPPMPANIKGGEIISPAMFYADAYSSQDWKRVTVRVQSAPIFATTQTDAIATLDNLVTP